MYTHLHVEIVVITLLKAIIRKLAPSSHPFHLDHVHTNSLASIAH